MVDETRAQMNGLVTDPSRILAGDAGFLELENAMCKRPGLVEPRGGFQARVSPVSTVDAYNTTAYIRETAFQQWFVATNGTNSRAYKWGDAANCLQVSGDESGMRAEPFADRQCWAFKKALRMLDLPLPASSASSLARLPGAPRAPGFYCAELNPGAGTKLLLADGEGVAYRVCIVRHITTTQGSIPLFGAPSDRVIFWNIVGGHRCDVRVKVPITNLGVGDEIQLYRSPISTGITVDPGDELQMVTSYRILTAPASGAVWTYDDSNSDDAWSGPALYTNDSQDGLPQSNYRIRVAKDVAFYNSMAFYAQGTAGQTATVTCRSLGFDGVDDTSKPVARENTLLSFTFTGDTLIGVPAITNCNPTVAAMLANTGQGIFVGQWVNLAVNDPETTGASAIKQEIIGWNSGTNTIAFASNATATVVGATYMKWDWVGIQALGTGNAKARIYAYPTVYSTFPWSDTSGVFYAGVYGVVGGAGRSFGGSDMERAWAFKYIADTAEVVRPRLYTAQASGFPYGSQCVMRWEWDDSPNNPGDSIFSDTFEVISSKPNAFSQQLGLDYSANLCRSKSEGGVARLCFSKLQLPESVPLGNYFDIGNLAAPIVRIVATTDCLWILKSDGLWRIAGTSPEDLIVQQFDPLCRMASAIVAGAETLDTAPWVRRLGNVVYAWTVSGIVSIDPSGVHPIDDAIATQIRALTPLTTSATTTSVTRPWAATSLRESLVVFGCQATGLDTDGFTFAYNTQTGTWSTWSTQLNASLASTYWFAGSGDADNETMLIGNYGGFSLYTDVPRFYTAAATPGVLPTTFADVVAGPLASTLTSLTIASVTGANALYSVAGSVLVPGAIIQQGGGAVANQYMVLAVVPGVSFTVDRSGLTAGACTISYLPIKQTLTYAATTEGTPAIEKYFQDFCFGFQNIRGGLLFRWRCRSRGDTTPSAWETEYYPLLDSQGISTLPTSNGLSADREFENARDFPTDQTRCTGLQVTVELNQAAVYSALDSAIIRWEPRSERVGGGS
jgi:hypothetical protein